MPVAKQILLVKQVAVDAIPASNCGLVPSFEEIQSHGGPQNNHMVTCKTLDLSSPAPSPLKATWWPAKDHQSFFVPAFSGRCCFCGQRI